MISYYLTVFLISLSVSLLSIPIIIKLSYKFQILDIPTKHKTHKFPIPTFGGLAIYFSFVMIVLYMLGRNLISGDTNIVLNLLLGGTLIVTLGIYDDLKGVSPLVKLSIQCLVAVIAYFFGFRINILTNPAGGVLSLGMAGGVITILWIIGIINAINLIDGIDGLAAGIVCIASFFLLLPELRENRVLIATILIGLLAGTLGFLRYNFPPAKIFLGDTGSMFIGYILACVSLIGTRKGTTAIALLVPIIILGVPVLEVLLSIIRRIINGEHPFKADKKHLHHRLLNIGMPPKRAALLLYGISIIFGGISFILTIVPKEAVIVILLVLLILCIIGLRLLELKETDYLEGVRTDGSKK
ncbi:MAG: MraY family glycosyltransferase [bacterium]